MKFTKIIPAAPAVQATPTPPAPPAPAPFCRLMPTVRPPAPPAPAPLTPQEIALFERFKARLEAEQNPVHVEHAPTPEPPQPPSAKTERLNKLFRIMEHDPEPRIRSARAWKEILDDGLWRDSFNSFRACCGNRLLRENWALEMIASIPIYEALPQASQALVKTNDELVELARFAKKDRVAILKRAAARRLTDGGQLATRITDAAKALGIKPEGKS